MNIDHLIESHFWDLIKATLQNAPGDERQGVVYIHGYNVTFRNAAIRAAQIGVDLKVPGVMAFFSWPSKGRMTAYKHDEATIDGSEAAIFDFLVKFATMSGASRVNIIAHSMGNRAFLRSLQRISGEAERCSSVKFGNIFLAAPDIDAGLFRDLAHLYPSLSERTTLYVSPSDKALGASKWLHNYARAGLTPPLTVIDGIDTIEVPDFNLDILGHGYFAGAAGVLHDIYDVLRNGTAPKSRQRLVSCSTSEGKPYWSVIA